MKEENISKNDSKEDTSKHDCALASDHFKSVYKVANAKSALAFKNKQAEHISLKMEATILRATYLSMLRLYRGPELNDFWVKAKDKLGRLFPQLIFLDVWKIYEDFYYRPKISLNKRNRILDKLITDLRYLQKYSSPDNKLGQILEIALSAIVSKQLQPPVSLIYRRLQPEDLTNFLSLKSLMSTIKLHLIALKDSNTYYDEQGTIKNIPKNIGFTKSIFKKLVSTIHELEIYSGFNPELGSLLEQAYNKILKPKFKPWRTVLDNENREIPELKIYSFHETMRALEDEINKLRAERKFYSPRNITTAAAKKGHLVQGFSNLVIKILGARKDAMTASIASTAAPQIFDGLGHLEVANILKNLSNIQIPNS